MLVDSGEFNGLPVEEAKKGSSSGSARGPRRAGVSYRLRDWGFSRQRYWGCPIPIVYCDDVRRASPVPDEELPVILPEVEDYRPKGKPPLAPTRSG